jgi:hypothetical protein
MSAHPSTEKGLMKIKRLTRALVAAVCAAAPLIVTVGTDVQPAAADTLCHVYSYNPAWENQTIAELTGITEATCGQTYTAVHTEAQLQEYLGVWQTMGYGDSVNQNANFGWADAYYDCDGDGANYFRTQGRVTGIMQTGWTSQDGWNNSGTVLAHCPAPPPVPLTK